MNKVSFESKKTLEKGSIVKFVKRKVKEFPVECANAMPTEYRAVERDEKKNNWGVITNSFLKSGALTLLVDLGTGEVFGKYPHEDYKFVSTKEGTEGTVKDGDTVCYVEYVIPNGRAQVQIQEL